MTNRERVLASLDHKQPDKVPYDVGFTQPAYAKMAEYYGDPHFGSMLGNCLTAPGVSGANAWREVEPGIWEDEFGVQWNRTVDKDIGVVSNTKITPETLAEYVFPDVDDPTRFTSYDEIIRNNPGQFIVANMGFTLFERAWTLAGMEEVLMGMVVEPEYVNTLLDRILEYNLHVIDRACAYPIDAMMFGDDWGQQTGVLMGPEMWREYIKPRVRQMYQRVKSYGKRVFIHSCGKVDAVFPDLIECGLDVFNPFQPEVIDVYEAKRVFGNDLSFFGGISTQRLLPYGTPDQVREEVKRMLDVVGKNGGYIAAPAHATPGDAKVENIAAMIEVLQGQ
ncbi:MAG: uroporphyrinogen decarboxylase family protein [Armatimonadota bacterium]